MKIAVLGISGMLGSAAFEILSQRFPGNVYGTARSTAALRAFALDLHKNVTIGIDVENVDALASYLGNVRPDAIINCVGVVKQLASADDPLIAIPINAILPHRLARLAALIGARLIHISTDCVFSGQKGNYRESDPPDAQDLYGRSKLLGEVEYPNAVTLRTSIIGREVASQNGLIEWFLSQGGPVQGYCRAIFSGLPTDELVRVIAERVLPSPDLTGVYHISADPISKFDLLHLVNRIYGASIEIESDDTVNIDRSLNSDRFRAAVSYTPPPWPELISNMHDFR